MQDPAEVVKITCARFCISYPGLAPIGIGGLRTLGNVCFLVLRLVLIQKMHVHAHN